MDLRLMILSSWSPMPLNEKKCKNGFIRKTLQDLARWTEDI